ncbi:MAG: 3-hydroxybutyryl-CoA dehydrogenase [Anaerolineae bacterium]|nr:3-hydroxybutyryl-CoA dehydrogenase [Anaerolineae bacterium]
MQLDQIRNILIIGAGTMGQQIGLQCAVYGYNVTLFDVKPEALEPAQAQIKNYADQLVAAGRLSQLAAIDVLARIRTGSDPAAAAANADLVSESVPEDPELKGRVFAQFHALCPPHTIFTSNTSSLIPSMFAAATGRPAQFAALHFHQTVWDSPVADVMPHPGTAPEVVELLVGFAGSIGQIPIVLNKENHGYVFNTMLNALNGAALTLASKGVTSIENIDRAWMAVMKTGIGPMGILDVVGLDTAWHITEYWAKTLQEPQLRANAEFLKDYVDRGQLGVKSGQGFYSYPNPAYAQPNFLTADKTK